MSGHSPRWWPWSESNRHLRLFRPALRPHQLHGQGGGSGEDRTLRPVTATRLAGEHGAPMPTALPRWHGTRDSNSAGLVLEACLCPARPVCGVHGESRTRTLLRGWPSTSWVCHSPTWTRWSRRWDSNPHARRPLFLRQCCLPFQHYEMVSAERFELSRPKATASETVLSTRFQHADKDGGG